MAAVLVGRTGELALVRAFAERARIDGEALLLFGEPGVGKTALLDAVAESASGSGTRVLRAAERGRKLKQGQRIPLGLRHNPLADPRRVVGEAGAHQVVRRLLVQRAKLAAGQPGAFEEAPVSRP